MRGFEVNVLTAFFIVIIVLNVVFASSSILSLDESSKELRLKSDVYVMRNSLEGAKIFAESSLVYSVYQGCFDYLKDGGGVSPAQVGGEELGVWYDNGDKSPTEEKFLGGLGTVVGGYLGQYTSGNYVYLKGNEVSFPEYSVEIKESEGSLEVRTVSTEFLTAFRDKTIERDEKITLEKDPTMERVVETSCLSLFTFGKNKARLLGERINVVVGEEVNKWEKHPAPLELEGNKLSLLAGSERDMADLVLTILYNGPGIVEIEREIKESVRRGVPKLSGGPYLEVKQENLELDVEIDPTCTAELVERTVGEEQKVFTVITCSKIEYNVVVVEKVTIKDTDELNSVPVNTGESVEMAPLELVFGVRVDLSLDDEHIVASPERDISGLYSVTIDWSGVTAMDTAVSLKIDQNGEELEGSEGDETFSGTLSGDSITLGEFVVPFDDDAVLDTEFGEYPISGDRPLITLEGTVQPDSSIVGTVSGMFYLLAFNFPIEGTFIAVKRTFDTALPSLVNGPIYFVPVSWDLGEQEFLDFVDENYNYMVRKMYNYEKATGSFSGELAEYTEEFSQNHPKSTATACLDTCDFDYRVCHFGLTFREKLERCLRDCGESLGGGFVTVGVSPHRAGEACGYTYFMEEDIAILTTTGDRFEEEKTLVHEFGHAVFTNCEEYEYSGEFSTWEGENDDLNSKGFKCSNPYPLCCEDHPQWEVDYLGYMKYLMDNGIGKNCAGAGAGSDGFCLGSVCIPQEGKKYCRSVMGPSLSPDQVAEYFEGSLEYQLPLPVSSGTE